MKTKSSLFSAIFLGALLVVEAQAGTLDDIGFTDLKLELGSALPDGSSVKVAQVEAADDDVTPSWVSNILATTFLGKNFTIVTPGSVGTSDHATGVGFRFYGFESPSSPAPSSSSPGISEIDLYGVAAWAGQDYLRTSEPLNPPNISASRVVNHSWSGSFDTFDGEILLRVDFVIERDEFLQVAAMRYLLLRSFNAITVSLLEGGVAGTTTALDSIYTSGRAKPDIVVPEAAVSMAVPRVASAAALLIDYGNSNPFLSTDPIAVSTSNRNGDTIYNAERSETIKAVLMAGADRNTLGNTYPDPPNNIDITDYRVALDNQTNNGLDTRFGAGQLNIYNSYHILSAGEQNSVEDLPDNLGAITKAGFDYDPSFGGSNASNISATYSYTTGTIGGQKLKAALVWNLEVLGSSAANLYNLDLQLIDVTDGNAIVASSASTIDNTENIWFDLKSNNEYQLKVIRGAEQAAFEWDYALAWQIMPSITVVETDSATVTAEDGTTDTFTVVLDSPPAGDVTIDLVSSDTAEGTVSPSSLLFTSANWNTLQSVTVTGVNDVVDDGNKNYSIDFTVSSIDANYNGLTLPGVSASNTDDDATFSFTDQADVALNTLITSNTVVVTGLLGTTAISVIGGEYSINGGAYTSTNGNISNTDSVTLQTTSSVTGLTSVDVMLTIGDVGDAFSVTTEIDTDGDGVGDSVDAFPNVIAASVDADNDALPDEWNIGCDTACQDSSGLVLDILLDDTDNDGVVNASDAFPNDPSETLDTDGDGIGDNADAFPNNIAASVDADNDGKPDEWNASCNTNCQVSSGLTLDVATSSTSSGGGGSLSLIWLLLPLFITASRRRVL